VKKRGKGEGEGEMGGDGGREFTPLMKSQICQSLMTSVFDDGALLVIFIAVFDSRERTDLTTGSELALI